MALATNAVTFSPLGGCRKKRAVIVGVALGGNRAAVTKQLTRHRQCLSAHHGTTGIAAPEVMQPQLRIDPASWVASVRGQAPPVHRRTEYARRCAWGSCKAVYKDRTDKMNYGSNIHQLRRWKGDADRLAALVQALCDALSRCVDAETERLASKGSTEPQILRPSIITSRVGGGNLKKTRNKRHSLKRASAT